MSKNICLLFFVILSQYSFSQTDAIRFSIDGSERMMLDNKTLHLMSPGESVFIGEEAGKNDDGANNRNTFIGFQSGMTNGTGGSNTFMGYKSGFANASSSHNTFLGYLSGTSNYSGFSNAFYGSNAGNKNLTGYYNTFVGRSAGLENVIGIQNTLIGKDAGKNILGSGNVCLGHDAGENEIGSNRLYIDNSNTSTPLIWGDFANDVLRVNGFFAIGDAYTFPVTDGQYGQVLISDGFGQLSWSPSPDINKLIDADLDTKIQVEASADEDKIRFRVGGSEIARLEDLRLAMDNVNIGNGAGGTNTDVTNVNVGQHAGSTTNIGANVAIGFEAMAGAYQFDAFSNVAVGFQSMGVGAGQRNTAVGHQAMRNGGEFSTALGHNALKNGGSWSVAVGMSALEENEGFYNVAVGNEALYPNQGSHNSAIGHEAMKVNKVGYNNTAVGSNSLGGNLNGDENVAIGVNALANIAAIDANQNTGLGGKTLLSNTTGDNLTAIGYFANVTNPNLNNATVIGANATVDCSNCLVLDTDADVGIRNSNPESELHIKHQNGGSSGYGLRLENSNTGGYIRMYTSSAFDGNLWVYSDDSPTSSIAEFDPITGIWYATSDARMKKNISPLENTLTEIMKLKPQSYHYLQHQDNRAKHYGFLAQDVKELFPSLVSYNNESDNYSVNYSGFGVLAIAAVQELVETNSELKNQIKQQQNKMEKMEVRIQKLESQLTKLLTDTE